MPIFDEVSSDEVPEPAPKKAKKNENQLDPMELKPCVEEIETQLEKTRLQYLMDDNNEPIDPIRIETMKKLSM